MVHAPTLVVIDVQREYVTPGRPFHLQGIEPSLENCRRILAHARAQGWPIVHVQHLQDGAVFPRAGEFGDFVPGFEPAADETHVVKSQLSAFTNPAFKVAIETSSSNDVLVIGYGSTMCCLATAVDSALFGRKCTFVHDASWARTPGPEFTEAETHRHATAILGIHARLATTDEILCCSVIEAAA